jgi:hypothetical protein
LAEMYFRKFQEKVAYLQHMWNFSDIDVLIDES